jgi:hypothetical protein
VAIKGRVGCGIDAHARSWRSGWKGWISEMIAVVDCEGSSDGIFLDDDPKLVWKSPWG